METVIAPTSVETSPMPQIENEAVLATPESLRNEQLTKVEDGNGLWMRSIISIPGVEGFSFAFRGKQELPDVRTILPEGISRTVALTPVYRGRQTELLSTDTLAAWVHENNGFFGEVNSGRVIEANMEQANEDNEQGNMLLIADSTPLGIAVLVRGLVESGVVGNSQISKKAGELATLSGETPESIEGADGKALVGSLQELAALSLEFSSNPAKALEIYLASLIGAPERRIAAQQIIDEAIPKFNDSQVMLRFPSQLSSVTRDLVKQDMDNLRTLMEAGVGDEERGMVGRLQSESFAGRRLQQFKESVSTIEDEPTRRGKLVDYARNEGLVLVHKDRARLSLGGKVGSLGDHIGAGTDAGFERVPGIRARETVHFTLNHTVSNAHEIHGDLNEGIDEQSNVVMPLSDTVEQSGLPINLFGVDTYFDHSVGIPENARIVTVSKKTESMSITTNQEGGYEITIPKGLTEEELEIFVGANYEQLGITGLYTSADSLVQECSRALSEATELYDRSSENALARGDDPKSVSEKPKPSLSRIVQDHLTQSAINELSGNRAVTSDGMSAYIQTNGFDKEIFRVAEEVGIRSGLHEYDDSVRFSERSQLKFLSQVTQQAEKGTIDTRQIDSSELWRALTDTRQEDIYRFIMHGYLSFEQNERSKIRSKVPVYG
ncbi:MAG: hypothetical protein Q7T41_04540 [Candidatus Saccharibacteria bacterium]|nr:hypothetical protein [Candidatus Saccharibacteria bacterium]